MQAPIKTQCSDCLYRGGGHTSQAPNKCRTCPFHLAAGYREDLGFVAVDSLRFVAVAGALFVGLVAFQPWIF
jgi:hypothetical protein